MLKPKLVSYRSHSNMALEMLISGSRLKSLKHQLNGQKRKKKKKGGWERKSHSMLSVTSVTNNVTVPRCNMALQLRISYNNVFYLASSVAAKQINESHDRAAQQHHIFSIMILWWVLRLMCRDNMILDHNHLSPCSSRCFSNCFLEILSWLHHHHKSV